MPNKILVVCYCNKCRFCVVCTYEYFGILDVYIIYLVFCCCCHHRRRFILICDQFGSHMWCATQIICNCFDQKKKRVKKSKKRVKTIVSKETLSAFCLTNFVYKTLFVFFFRVFPFAKYRQRGKKRHQLCIYFLFLGFLLFISIRMRTDRSPYNQELKPRTWRFVYLFM